MMKSAAIAAILCYAVAMGMALPSQVARSESGEFEVQAQWHFRAPARGCVEVYHYVGGSYFRTYACDSNQGPCLYSPSVEICSPNALFHKPNLERIVNIRSRDHAVRFYNQIGGACVFTILPQCTCNRPLNTAIAVDTGYTKGQAEDCKCVDLPSGEKLCDPIDCRAESQAKDCKCVDLPSGERLCDPIDCEGREMQIRQGQAEHKNAMKALLKYIRMKKN